MVYGAATRYRYVCPGKNDSLLIRCEKRNENEMRNGDERKNEEKNGEKMKKKWKGKREVINDSLILQTDDHHLLLNLMRMIQKMGSNIIGMINMRVSWEWRERERISSVWSTWEFHENKEREREWSWKDLKDVTVRMMISVGTLVEEERKRERERERKRNRKRKKKRGAVNHDDFPCKWNSYHWN